MNMNRRVRRGWLLLLALIAGTGGGWAVEPPAPLAQARALLRPDQTPKPEQLAAALKALHAQGDNWAEAAFLRAELALKIGGAQNQEIARKAFEELAAKAANPWKDRGRIGLLRARALKGENAVLLVHELNALTAELAKDEDQAAIDGAYYVALLCEQTGQAEAARQARAYAVAQMKYVREYYGPHHYSGILTEEQLRPAKPTKPPNEPRDTFARARKAQEGKRYAEALLGYRAVIKGWPEHVLAAEAGYRIGECVHLSGKANEAKTLLMAFIEARPLGPWQGQAHLLFGRISLETDLDAGAAESHFSAVLHPGRWADERKKKAESATDEAAKATGKSDLPVSPRPDGSWETPLADALEGFGICLFMRREFERAARVFGEEIGLRPQRRFGPCEIPTPMAGLRACCERKEYPVPFADEVMRGDKKVQTLLFFAGAYAECGSYERAATMLKRLLGGELKAAEPIHLAYAQYEYAEVLRLLWREDESLAAFKALLDKYPSAPMIPRATLELAGLHLQRNEYAEARRLYDLIWRKYPRHPEAPRALYFIGYEHYFAKQWAEALRAFDTLVAYFPNSWEGERVKKVEIPYLRFKVAEIAKEKAP